MRILIVDDISVFAAASGPGLLCAGIPPRAWCGIADGRDVTAAVRVGCSSDGVAGTRTAVTARPR